MGAPSPQSPLSVLQNKDDVFQTTTPVNLRPQQLKIETIEQVRKEAEEAMSNSNSTAGGHDIGPFYGLPSKVQKILEQQRGISKLYGKSSSFIGHGIGVSIDSSLKNILVS